MATTQTITILFTDLVGSTELSSRLGPSATEELRSTHFGLLRGAIQASGGTEVKNLGDGLMVAFSSLSRALACAVGMQQAIERHNRRDGNVLLSVRVGLSAGEATEEDGDYFGDPVIEAARLCAKAEGGQILAAAIVQALAGRHATQEFASIGDLDLKGLPEPVPVVEVVWEPETAVDEVYGRIPLPGRLVGASAENLFAFFGRSEELARLGDIQKVSSSEHQLRVTLISGEPGIGKTSLVAQASRAAHAAGANVLYGNCTEDLGVPYQPWITALTTLADHADQPMLRDFVDENGPALTRLVPGIARRLELAATRSESDADTERFLMLEGVARFLALMSMTAPLVMVLDDLHWVDAASLQLLRHLIGTATPMPVQVIGTFRDSDLSRSHPLTGALADLRRESFVERLDLVGLEDADIIDLMAAAAGHDLESEGVALAHALGRETGGNPFYLVEVVRHLAETGAFVQDAEGHWVLSADLEGLDLPTSVREVVGQRVARLGSETEGVLSLASVIGREFDLDALTALLDFDADRLLDLLEAAIGAGLISESESTVGRYRFRHALIQHTLYQDLSSTRRQRAHRRVAEWLESHGVADDRLAPELARHWMMATRPSDGGKALHYARRAGDAALAAYAPIDAVKWYTQALDIGFQSASEDERVRCELLIGLGTSQRQAGQPEHRSTLREAGRIALALGDRNLLVEVALSRDPGVEAIAEPDPDRVAVVEAALEAVGHADTGARAHLLANLADETDPRDVDRRVALASEAVDVARRVGDDPILLSVLNMVAISITTPETMERRLIETELALELAARLDDAAGQFDAHSSRLQALAECRDLVGVDACMTGSELIAARTGLPHQKWVVLVKRTWRHLFSGELSQAQRGADELFELGAALGLAHAESTYGSLLFCIRLEQGRLADLVDLVEEAVRANPTLPSWGAAITTVYCELGRFEDARPYIDAALASNFSSQPFDITWLASMSGFADCVADTGRADAGLVIHEQLSPYRGRLIFLGATDNGVVDRTLGRLATLLGRYDEAESHLLRAIELHRSMNAPYWTARSQLDLVELLVTRGDAADGGASADLIRTARQTIVRYGFGGLDLRANRLLARR